MKTTSLSRRNFVKNTLSVSAFALTSNASFSMQHLKTETTQQSPDKARIAALLKDPKPLIWVFNGDSITHGAKHTNGYRSYPEIFAERIRWEMQRRRDIVINTGISGNTTRSILDDFDWRVKQLRPNVVSLMIGTNDCANEQLKLNTFEENLLLIVKNIRDLNAIPILHTPNSIIVEQDRSRAGLSKYVSVIRDVAGKQQVILVDNYAHWEKVHQKSPSANIYKEWLDDAIHPNGPGHAAIARELFRELSIFDKDAATCAAPPYE